LEAQGIHGNRHVMMLEKNNRQINRMIRQTVADPSEPETMRASVFNAGGIGPPTTTPKAGGIISE
jgi:hypothetical protein